MMNDHLTSNSKCGKFSFQWLGLQFAHFLVFNVPLLPKLLIKAGCCSLSKFRNGHLNYTIGGIQTIHAYTHKYILCSITALSFLYSKTFLPSCKHNFTIQIAKKIAKNFQRMLMPKRHLKTLKVKNFFCKKFPTKLMVFKSFSDTYKL